MSNAVPHVYTAITAVMAHLAEVGIGKDRKNEQQGYAFRGIDDVYNALAGVLAKNSLCILPQVKHREVVERLTARGTPLFYVNVDVDFSFVSAKDGSSHVVSVAGEAMDSADKATNKAMSAAYKYACLQAFCIPTEGDNDADSTTHDVATKVVRQDKAAAPAPTVSSLITPADIEVVAGLAKTAGVDLAAICASLKIDSLEKMQTSALPIVIKRLQTKIAGQEPQPKE